MPVELLAEKLRALRTARGWSVRALSHATVRLGNPGVGERTIQLLEAKPGRVPDAGILEAIAAALEVPPEVFHEYPIAVARRAAGTSEAVRQREEDSLRKRAQLQGERQPEPEPKEAAGP